MPGALDENRFALERMSSLLAEIKDRIAFAENYLADNATNAAIEIVALQLRICVELVALSSLVSHEPLMEKGRIALQRLDADDARKAVKRINPHYWPQPVFVKTRRGRERELDDLAEPYLHEEAYGRWIGRTSDWLHATNPWRDARTTERGLAHMRELRMLLMRLLNNCFIRLAGSDLALICQMDTSEDGLHNPGSGKVQVAVLRNMGNSQIGD